MSCRFSSWISSPWRGILLAVTAFGVATGAQAPAPAQPGLLIGQVIDAATTQPVADALVTLTGGPAAAEAGASPAVRMAVSPKVLTDSSGQFVFRNVAPGSYSISVSRAGYVNGAYGVLTPHTPGATLDVAAGERITDLTLSIWHCRPATTSLPRSPTSSRDSSMILPS